MNTVVLQRPVVIHSLSQCGQCDKTKESGDSRVIMNNVVSQAEWWFPEPM